MKLIRYSLKRNFIVFFGIFILSSCLVLTSQGIKLVKKTGSALASVTGRTALQRAAKVIDTEKYKDLLNSMSADHPYYEEFRLQLLDIKETTGCRFLYTMMPKDSTNAVYIVDGSGDPSESDFSKIGTVEDISSYGTFPHDACKGSEIVYGGIEEYEEWGHIQSSYWGIKDKNGRSLGFIGCDVDMNESQAIIKANTYRISTIGFCFVIEGILLIVFMTTFIFGKLKKITSAMAQLSEGDADLTVRLREGSGRELHGLAHSCNLVISKMDIIIRELQAESVVLAETGTALSEQMSEHVGQISSSVSSVQSISSRISNQTTQIDAINNEINNVQTEINSLDARLVNQSEAIHDSSAAIDEISTQIEVMNSNIEKVVNEYSALVDEASQGRSLQDSVSEQIQAIAEQSQNLTEANRTIATIASQTNLLAMNAAIEAAHAGEAGKGFSVVADEIRKLSETSSAQSNQIKQLLENISKSIAGIVESSAKTSLSFDNVGSKINELNGLIIQVKEGMGEQTIGMNNILDTMHTLSETTNDITKASELMKDASSKVVMNSKDLKVIAEETKSHSLSVSQEMSDIAVETEKALKATEKNLEATKIVSDMINGFKV